MIVQSPNEVKFYENYSSNPVHFIPFSCPMDNLPEKIETKSEEYLFSGGYSNRDYELLFKSIRQTPHINFVIVASTLNKNLTTIPDNATVYMDIDNKQFNQLLINSSGVIIPLKKDVGASGQLVSLLAMQSRKPVIYCNISVINYYFIPNKTGIPYELGNAESLNNAIKMLTHPEFDKKKMADEAFKRCSENFTKKKRDDEFINIIKTHIKTKSKKMRFSYSLLLKE
ncbi:MAG TPA: glycosyltransferase [Draconibacterium sp.]|nr:glycosyltransferase [Draconibacterium sp.]